MLSYAVGIFAVLLLLANPISQFFFPQKFHISVSSTRPPLNESLLAIDGPNATAPVCPEDAYATRILSREPLVVYLEGFLSKDERAHLLDISEPLFEPSTITHDSSATHRDTAVRDSSVALIPRTDTVRCIEARARALQGWRRDVWIERLRTQRYVVGGHYNHHFDWSSNSLGWGRVSSFMVWVDGSEDLEGGGTEFPLLQTRSAKDTKKWCELVECKAEGQREGDGEKIEGRTESLGTTFKVVPGNAVYWENFAPNGVGYDSTWHAGMPVEKGHKVGLNIWSFGRIE